MCIFPGRASSWPGRREPGILKKTNGKFGPGILVAAAFIGPGTITTASIAGAQFGFALLWALAFSVAATILLQEMAARLALVTRRGLSETLRATYHDSWLGAVAVMLVVAAKIRSGAVAAGNFRMLEYTGLYWHLVDLIWIFLLPLFYLTN